MGLDRHIADPSTDRPPEADPAWFGSPPAKEFIRASAEGWGQADIAGGADKMHALAVAEVTRKFYSGET